ncbi:MAG: DegT/DnrJ/EryC1/StrS family aminotransferase [Gammaproteobacteria bacterium]|nr:DegT/DnrJ/EryC1/StrS family aminotransferase [Gammaproteobacteria bacterium]
MFYQLPPAGNPIRLHGTDQPESVLHSVFSPYQAQFFASGTAALAAAIVAAVRLKQADEPEVILPAYGCPDLVSAVVFAGAKPVLVDLVADRPWLDLQQLPAKINSRTVAIVAASLFGIPERMTELRPLAERAGVVLIEDGAQLFPGSQESNLWKGDLVVLSFGRGKPVSLLGGGAVLFREDMLARLLPQRELQHSGGMYRQAAVWLQTALYNLMIAPRLYWIPQAIPFLHLGETRFQPLPAIDTMDPVRLRLLPSNIAAYRDGDMDAQNALARILTDRDPADTGVIDLPRACQVPGNRRLLRYPLLVEAELRGRLYQELRRQGLGPSTMYPATLPGITGMKALLAGQGRFPAAEDFAARILTLPTHRRVSAGDIEQIRQVFALR